MVIISHLQDMVPAQDTPITTCHNTTKVLPINIPKDTLLTWVSMVVQVPIHNR